MGGSSSAQLLLCRARFPLPPIQCHVSLLVFFHHFERPAKIHPCPPTYGLAEGIETKKRMAGEVGLWFLHENATTTVFRGARWNDMVVPASTHTGAHFTLPCAAGSVAWQQS